MKNTFTAIDGKTFDSERECIEHEEFLSCKGKFMKDIIIGCLQEVRESKANPQTGTLIRDWDESRIAELMQIIELIDSKIGFDILSDFYYELSCIFDGCNKGFKRFDLRSSSGAVASDIFNSISQFLRYC